MNLLLQDIARYITLESGEEEIVLRLVEIKNYKSNTFIFKEGEECKYLYFVNKGVLCGYVSKNQNIDKIIRLATSGQWITDLKSFHNQIPSRFYVKTLEDSEVVQLNFENYEELFRVVPKMERYFRMLLCEALMNTTNRVKDSLTLTAEERYDEFIKEFPNLAYHISQKYIASYIGVTPQFFSKMKSHLFKK